MSPLSGLIVLLAVIVVVQGQLALPAPVKNTKIATLQVGLSVTSGVSIQHLPDSDNIVVVWLDMETSYTNATARGAIVSTNGEVKATFLVSESSTVLSIATPAQIVPQSSNNFTVVFSTIYGGVFIIRSFNSSGQPLTDSIFVDFEAVLISMNAVYDKGTGDLFIVGANGLITGNQLVVARLSLTGEVKDAAGYATAATNVSPTIAVSGDSVAFSVAVVNADSGEANLQVFVANLNDLTNFTTFFPYGEGASSTVAQQVIADPLNENTFVVISSTGLVVDSAFATKIAAIRFNRDNSSIAQTLVDYSGLALSVSTSLDNNKGVLIVTTFTNPSYVLYPIQITSDTALQLDTDQLEVLHAITAAEQAFDTYKDMRTATTTWSTGSAAVWTEVSANTAAFSIVTQIFGTYCGDNLAEGNETCDGGASCNADCSCPTGLVADGNNGCGNAPVGTPSTPTSTRPINVGPVASTTPKASTSDAADTMTTTTTVTAALMVAMATLF